MTPEKKELLLLCTLLGDRLSPLNLQQYRVYTENRAAAENDARITALSAREQLLDRKMAEWSKAGISVVTALDHDYPASFLNKLGEDAPPVLFLLGNPAYLLENGISLVGSRELREENRRFAEAVGRTAAKRGLVLVSGDAKGADRTAQQAAVDAGGCVVSFVLDSLLVRKPHPQILYVSEESPEAHYSLIRAHARNRLIHCFGSLVYVAQTADGTGGSWSGSIKNLRRNWTPLYVYDDGSAAAAHLIAEGGRACDLSMFRDTEME